MTDERAQRPDQGAPTPREPQPPFGAQPAAAVLAPAGEQPPEAAQERARSLVDGDWHRLHPATPLLRGGLAAVVVIAILLNSLRDRIVAFFIPSDVDYDGEDADAIQAVEYLAAHGTLIWVLVALVGVLALFVVGCWFTWRVHRFRITGDVVEVRRGLVFRSHRRAPLARIQGVNVEKPWFARIFGACKLEIQSAGADANVELAYLSNAVADALRYEILARAAGREVQRDVRQDGTRTQRVVAEFVNPDAEIADVVPSSLIRLKPATVILSSLLDVSLLLGVVGSIVAVVLVIVLEMPWLLFALIPTVLTVVSISVRELSQKLRYSIAQTPDGLRLAYGLLSTTTEVLPAGRIFSVTVSQPLLWRPMGWWKVAFTRATKTAEASSGQQKQYANMLLPVGSRADVDLVVGLVLPALRGSSLLDAGLEGRGRADADSVTAGAVDAAGGADATTVTAEAASRWAGDGYVTTPRSARILRPFSWRRNGVAFSDDAVLLRKGRIWRSLGIVPLARTQSFAMHQGPLEGALGVAHVAVHVVGSALSPTIGALAVEDAQRTFGMAREVVPAAIGADTTETWHVRTPSTVDWSSSGPIDGMEQQNVTNRPEAASAAHTTRHERPEGTGDDVGRHDDQRL